MICVDWKENVIVGRLIPAGTGLAYHNNRRRQGRQSATIEHAESRFAVVPDSEARGI